ncbi:MAG: hypothetical protein R2800_03160 [Flavipsychrobacter sp.]
MKKHIISFSFILSILCSVSVNAQQRPSIGCVDKEVRLQSEQIKRQFKEQGLTVYKDAMVQMEPRQPFSIAVQLTQGQLYQLLFVGSKKASKITMELFDGKDNLIDKKTLTEPEKNNFIIYSFAPLKSDIYLIVLTQKIKGKKVCSSFSILQNNATAMGEE